MLEGYLTAGMPLGRLGRLVWRHGISPTHLGRLGFLAQSGLGGSLFGEEPQAVGPVDDPLIILGHWRTGTTYLHQLLNQDPRFAAPTLLQTVYPAAFEQARQRAAPGMSRALPEHRPMDRVRLGLDEPQEDEGALWRLTGLSPLERLVFPKDERYFLLDDETFLPAVELQPMWDRALTGFVQRVARATGRRVVLKNPFHSVRIPTLDRLFPKALYLRIDGEAQQVIPSTIHMWTVVGAENRLRTTGGPPALDEVISVFEWMQARMDRDLAAIPAGRKARLTFPELEAHPTETVARALETLGLGMPEASERPIRAFASAQRSYQRNSYAADEGERRRIAERLPRTDAPPGGPW